MKPLIETSCAVVVCIGLLASGVSGCKRSGEEPQLKSAQEVLDAMVAAYQKAESYSDEGEIRLVAVLEDQKRDDPAPFSVAFVRPSKIGVRAYQAEVAIDGEQTLATLIDLPDQALVKDAPAKLTPEAVYCDPILAGALVGTSGAPPQLALLFEKEPLKQILGNAAQPELGEPAEIDGHKCYCVRAKWPGDAGVETLWIDQQTFVLRRIEYPVGGQEKNYFPDRAVKKLSVTANFKNAQFNTKVPDRLFQLEIPAGANLQKFFRDLDPRQLLGRKIGPFGFVDLGGNGVTRDALAGKITVLCFWDCDAAQSRQALEQLEKLSQLYRRRQRPGSHPGRQRGPGQPRGQDTDRDLRQMGHPSAHRAGPPAERVHRVPHQGCAHAFCTRRPGRRAALRDWGQRRTYGPTCARLEELVGGKSIYGEPLRRYREEVAREDRMRLATAAERSAPGALKLRSLWKSADVSEPGNILVVEDAKAVPRLVIVSGAAGGCRSRTRRQAVGYVPAGHRRGARGRRPSAHGRGGRRRPLLRRLCAGAAACPRVQRTVEEALQLSARRAGEREPACGHRRLHVG